MIARRLMLPVLVCVCTGVGALGLTVSSALAAPPELPETKSATAVTATTASVHGMLDPKAASTELIVEYGFFYAAHGAVCTEGSFAPESPGMAPGNEGEKVELGLTRLQPNAQYKLCVAVRNPGEEGWTVGNAVGFSTPPAAPSIESVGASDVRTGEAHLEGVINPNNELSECKFQYGTEASLKTGTTTTVCEPASFAASFGGQGVGLNLGGLQRHTTYYYRLIAENEQSRKEGKPAEGTIGHFETPIAPETPEKLKAEPVGTTTATLKGVLNPNNAGSPGSYEFVYRQSTSECQRENPETGQRENEKTSPEPAGASSGTTPEPVYTEITGLLPGGEYTFCLIAHNAAGEEVVSAPVTFTTIAVGPKVEEEFVTTVASTSATLHAKVNPHGAETSYSFEYAVAGGAFKPVPESGGDGTLPAGANAVQLSVHVQHELAPGATYDFRVVASNTMQRNVTGETVSFTTQRSGGGSTLPDGRQWEMVSPPQKEGALLGYIQEGIIQAAADGNAFTDESSFEAIEEDVAGDYGFIEENFFGRSPGGWVSKTITPPHSGAGNAPVGNGQEYRFFSEDLSKAILQPFGPATPLAPEVSQSTAYIHTDYLNGNQGELCDSGCYRPLVSDANVPPGTQYGEEEEGLCIKVHCGPEVVAVSPDFSHVLLSSPVALTAGSSGGLYEWAAGKLTFVGNGALGAPGENAAKINSHVISDDGSRIFINGSYEGVEGLLLRDTATGETIRLDAPQGSGLSPVPPGQANFQTASADGSRIFFTSGLPLTEDASEPALYEYDLNAPVGSRLTDLSVDENAGEAAGVSSVLGASEDGSYVYFAASGVLAPSASHVACTVEPCATNLYVRHDGTTRFVAGLGAEDSPDWVLSGGNGLTARVSPNGQWLVFMSNRDLTGYDATDAVSGRPDEEVYLYDASTGKLACASCNPTGARPVGVEYGESDSGIVKADRVFPPNTWIAANVPPWTRYALEDANYQSRYLSDSGRLFFDSHDALVPQDVNGTQDVYEYEPPGSGDCSVSEVTFSGTAGGCVSLISSGESNEESVFLDASETGGDVFFLTASKLVAQDFDNAYDVYDARECSNGRCLEPAPVSPPPCNTGDSCKPAPTPQPAIFGSPASATFSGAGNITSSAGAPAVKSKGSTRAQQLARVLKACARKKGKRRKTCERQAHARYGARKFHKANTTKRSGR
jgi:WD40-like Beta Propeller Repeat